MVDPLGNRGKAAKQVLLLAKAEKEKTTDFADVRDLKGPWDRAHRCVRKNQAVESKRVLGGFRDRSGSPYPNNTALFPALLGLQRGALGVCKHRFEVLVLIDSRRILANSVVLCHVRLCCNDQSSAAYGISRPDVSGHPILSCDALQAFNLPQHDGETSTSTRENLSHKNANKRTA